MSIKKSLENLSTELSKIDFSKIGNMSNYSHQDYTNYGSNLDLILNEHPMKDTLEYEILKYLSDNDNGEFLDVS